MKITETDDSIPHFPPFTLSITFEKAVEAEAFLCAMRCSTITNAMRVIDPNVEGWVCNIQEALQKHVIGGLDHPKWFSFCNQLK
jgi:hypothetical protein